MSRMQVEYEPRHAAALSALLRDAPRANAEGMREVERAIREAVGIERLAGRDADGRPLRRVRTRIGRYASASGPPMAPFGLASRSVTGFFVNALASPDGFSLVAGYQGEFARILRYHADGKAGTGFPVRRDGEVVGFRGIPGRVTGIRRDVFGLGPAARAGVREVLRAHTGRLRLLLRSARSRAASFFS